MAPAPQPQPVQQPAAAPRPQPQPAAAPQTDPMATASLGPWAPAPLPPSPRPTASPNFFGAPDHPSTWPTWGEGQSAPTAPTPRSVATSPQHQARMSRANDVLARINSLRSMRQHRSQRMRQTGSPLLPPIAQRQGEFNLPMSAVRTGYGEALAQDTQDYNRSRRSGYLGPTGLSDQNRSLASWRRGGPLPADL
jgi:hypothetical protein